MGQQKKNKNKKTWGLLDVSVRAAQPDTEHKLENLMLGLTDISVCLWPG